MRSLGTIDDSDAAERFVAHLLTQGIRTQVESIDGGGRVEIWVRDEDLLPQAKEESGRSEVRRGDSPGPSDSGTGTKIASQGGREPAAGRFAPQPRTDGAGANAVDDGSAGDFPSRVRSDQLW